MNPQLQLFLILRLSDYGFALPIVLGIGLFRLLARVTMMILKQRNQIQVAAKKSFSQEISLAEIGTTFSQKFLLDNNLLKTRILAVQEG